MPDTLTTQARRLYQVFASLVRAYQFRDRDEICCHGISVSQCYTLDSLAERGPRTMSELSADLFLEISSMTRAVDPLVADGLVARVADPHDRRVRRVRITPRGRSLLKTIHADLIREYEDVLGGIAPESRPAVLQAMAALLDAFQNRQSCCAARAPQNRDTVPSTPATRRQRKPAGRTARPEASRRRSNDQSFA